RGEDPHAGHHPARRVHRPRLLPPGHPDPSPGRPGVHAEPRVHPLSPGLVRRAPARAQGQPAQAGDPPPDRRRPRRAGRRPGRAAGGRGSPVAGRLARDRADDPRGPGRDGVAGGPSVERSLGLIAAGGALPARAAAEARRQGWRVVAFTFDTAPGLEAASDVLVPSALADIPATIQRLMVEQVTAALFVGKFAKQRLVEADTSDHSVRRLAGDGLSDGALGGLIATTLGQLGIEVLDQRPFLSPWMAAPGVLTTRPPTAEEWTEIRGGLALARPPAAHRRGPTLGA